MTEFHFHYDGLRALSAIIDEGSFEKAAQFLRISQSAVTQRIHALEQRAGAPVLVRSSPPRLTTVGNHLYTHMRKIQSIEADTKEQLEPDSAPLYTHIRIAVNNDSLHYWFIDALADIVKSQK